MCNRASSRMVSRWGNFKVKKNKKWWRPCALSNLGDSITPLCHLANSGGQSYWSMKRTAGVKLWSLDTDRVFGGVFFGRSLSSENCNARAIHQTGIVMKWKCSSLLSLKTCQSTEMTWCRTPTPIPIPTPFSSVIISSVTGCKFSHCHHTHCPPGLRLNQRIPPQNGSHRVSHDLTISPRFLEGICFEPQINGATHHI